MRLRSRPAPALLALLFAALPAAAERAAARPKAKPLDAQARAEQVAAKLPVAHQALRESRLAAAALADAPLRAAVEAQLAAPWLPPDAWALSHRAEAEALLRAERLLGPEEPLVLPAARGSFAAAPGGTCPDGHHGYPGGLAVHSWVNLLHARGLAQAYERAYAVKLDDGWLVAAALWHDALKAATLPWDDQGGCPAKEPQLGGTALHHVLGVAAAMLRRLPQPLVWVIASAHAPPSGDGLARVCGWLRAGSIVAFGRADAACPAAPGKGKLAPLEAFVTAFADADYSLSGPAWAAYAAATPSGWARFDALAQDGNDIAAWSRAQAR